MLLLYSVWQGPKGPGSPRNPWEKHENQPWLFLQGTALPFSLVPHAAVHTVTIFPLPHAAFPIVCVYIKHCACNLSWKLIRSFFICYMLHISTLDSAQDKTPQDTSGKGILPKARWNGSCQSDKRCQRTHTGHGVITGQVTVMLHSPVL